MNSRNHVIRRGLALGFCVWVAVLIGMACAAPGELWIRHYHALPSTSSVVAIAATLVVVFSPRPIPRLINNLLLTGVMGAHGFATRVQPLGDYTKWIEVAQVDHAALSDLLANVIYRSVYRVAGVEGMSFVAPICGLVFTFLLLRVADGVCARPDDPHPVATKRFSDVSCLVGSWFLLYGRGYVENTQLSLPFVLLAILPLHEYRTSDRPRRGIALASLWLSLGAAMHGQVVALLPAVPLVIWLGAASRPARTRLIDFAVAATVCAATLGIAVGGTWASGFYIHFGHIHPLLFVPWAPHPLSRFTLLGPTHLRFCGNVLLLASPLVAVSPLLLLRGDTRRRWLEEAQTAPALLLLALGYCGYSFFVLFALQFPRDFDLAIGLGIVLHLFALRQVCVVGATRSPLPWIVLALGGIAAAVVTASLRVDPSDVQRGDAGELLRVNGRVGDVVIRLDEKAVIEVRGNRSFRLVGRVKDSGAVIELGSGQAPWISKSLELGEHVSDPGAEIELELRWDPIPGEPPTETTRARLRLRGVR